MDANEPLSADELNFIARTNIGLLTEYFGFPTNYTEYGTGRTVGGAGIQPRIAFQPIPDPFTGRESEGANDIVFAPPGFPDCLNTGKSEARSRLLAAHFSPSPGLSRGEGGHLPSRL